MGISHKERMEEERNNQKEDEYWASQLELGNVRCVKCGEKDFLNEDGLCPICEESVDNNNMI